MSMRIVLDQSHGLYTNLDTVAGRVVLALPRAETFNAIVVKLECESRTRLAAPRVNNRETYETELEVHKLLYKTATVFPAPQLQNAGGPKSSYTIPPGQHEFRFSFKLPFNSACAPVSSFIDRLERPQDFNPHIKRPLPPTLSGFQGEAGIRYYVKATAQRAAFFKENFREEVNLTFLPIEPMRPPANRRESYARRQHQFAPSLRSPKAAMFARKDAPDGTMAPSISIDSRLPDPAILTCNQPVPLRVLVRKLNDSPEQIFLQLFQIMLVGYTKIRAHDLVRTEKSSWVIVSKANMAKPLGKPSTGKNQEMVIDASLWSNVRLPNTVPPTFEICNISRTYELEVSCGLAFGTGSNIKPEMTIQPLRMPVKVYSGVKPPEALVQQMARRQNRPGTAPLQAGAPSTSFDGNLPPYTPAASTTLAPPDSEASAQASTEIPEAPPPTYEDAIAEDLGPVDGSARPNDYHQPIGQHPVGNGEKRSASGSHSRLFP